MSNKASLLKSDEKGFVIMLTPYQKEFVEEFKIKVPYPHRKWDPDKKVWLVAETMLEATVELMKKYFDDISTNLLTEETGNNLWESVFTAIPNDYIDVVYRALCQAVHPDHGGTDEQMKQLNMAYNARKSE